MTAFMAERRKPVAIGVNVSDDTLTVDLGDGRSVSVPLAWYPRLTQPQSVLSGV